MIIGFEVYRSSNNELIEDSSIKVDVGELFKELPLEDDVFISKVIEVIQNTLTQYLESTEYVTKYGTAYVGDFKIRSLVFGDNEVALSKQELIQEFNTKMPNITILYDETTNNTTEEEKVVKLDFGTSVKEENTNET